MDQFKFERPKKSNSGKEPISICLTDMERKQAKHWAGQHGVSVSAFFAGLLAAYIQHEKERGDNESN